MNDARGRRRMTADQIAEAGRLLSNGASYSSVAEAIGFSAKALRDRFDPNRRAAKALEGRAQSSRRAAADRETLRAKNAVVDRSYAPDPSHAAYDPARDGPMPPPDTLAGLLFGDPSPARQRIMRTIR